MNRKNRIVVKGVEIEYWSEYLQENIVRFVFQEVYTSAWKTDCISWINRQADKDNVSYRIYVEDK